MSTDNRHRPRFIPIEALSGEEGGGKASGLARLARLGLAVPRTYVLLDTHPGETPGDLSRTWMDAGGGRAAVRSSGSDEDGMDASAAGQFETYLDVPPEGLADAVEKCLESAHSERVTAYEKELSGTDCASMSVVIQDMVRPSRSGVVFTADPITGDRNVMVAESVAGLGEQLVSGHAEAASYRLSVTDGRILEAPENPGSDGLDPELLEDLRTGAVLAAAEWGVPLDLEWAEDEASGNLFWLQARPITALADSLDSDVSPNTLITRCNIGEMMPGAVTPLTLSTFGRSLSNGLAIYYRSFGALKRKDPDPSFVESFDEQLHMNLTNMYVMSRRVLGATPEGTELGILGYVLPPHDIGPLAPFPVRLINGIRYFGGLFGWKRKLRKLEKLATGFRIDTQEKDAAGILDAIRAAHGPVMDRAVALHYAGSAFSGAMNAALAITLSGGNAITDESNRLLTELLSGVEGVESAAVLEGLEELAGILRREQRRELLEGDDADAIHAALMADVSEIGSFYRGFMERHGHRCIREAELREPEWARQPGHLIESLRALAESPGRPAAARPAGSLQEWPELPEGVNAKAVKWITGQARSGVKTREKSKSLLILVTHGFKVAVRALAERLETEGYLPEADLTYFLTLDELTALLSGTGDGLIGRARRRRRLYPERQELRFPDLSTGRPEPEMPTIPEGGTHFRGTPVSRGIAEGSVRVVKNRKDAESLERGEIMVAQFTDIGWTPFYGRVAGMITEIGGALSHGSVVAREYGLPLVGGLSGACTFLQNGMKIRLDGGTGMVTLLDEIPVQAG